MFTDELRDKVWTEIRRHDLRAFRRLLPDEVFVEAAQMAAVRLGRSALSLVQMTWLGIGCAIHVSKNFSGVLQSTLKILDDACNWQPTAVLKATPKPKTKHGGKTPDLRRKDGANYCGNSSSPRTSAAPNICSGKGCDASKS